MSVPRGSAARGRAESLLSTSGLVRILLQPTSLAPSTSVKSWSPITTVSRRGVRSSRSARRKAKGSGFSALGTTAMRVGADRAHPLAEVVRDHHQREAARAGRRHPLGHPGGQLGPVVGADRVVEIDHDPADAGGGEGVQRDLGERVGVRVGAEPVHAIPASVHSSLTPLGAVPQGPPAGPQPGPGGSTTPARF